MNRLRPALLSTKVCPKTNEWAPASFQDFLFELKTVTEAIEAADSKPLFRGQRRSEWSLDSTFSRAAKARLFGMNPEECYAPKLLQSGDLHVALASLLLLKFGLLLELSAQLRAVEKEHGVDALFEFMKRCQQYPEMDSSFLKGTNFIDWSTNSDVAIYFANDEREGAGALFICDTAATGATLQTHSVNEILQKIRGQLSRRRTYGAPLLLIPKKQLANQRARNQQAFYFAQMELRIDLQHIWRLQESQSGQKTILVKLVLPAGTEDEVTQFLEVRGIDCNFIYPDKLHVRGGRKLDRSKSLSAAEVGPQISSG